MSYTAAMLPSIPIVCMTCTAFSDIKQTYQPTLPIVWETQSMFQDMMLPAWLDERKCVLSDLLVLLDLSAALDTIDHNSFLERLANEYGMTGDVPDWMGSYLQSRQQVISINSSVSDKNALHNHTSSTHFLKLLPLLI
jgi:hypothetical protein